MTNIFWPILHLLLLSWGIKVNEIIFFRNINKNLPLLGMIGSQLSAWFVVTSIFPFSYKAQIKNANVNVSHIDVICTIILSSWVVRHTAAKTINIVGENRLGNHHHNNASLRYTTLTTYAKLSFWKINNNNILQTSENKLKQITEGAHYIYFHFEILKSVYHDIW